ncbi:MAG: alpha/beta hydrolase [Betaproteobacteria bacterium]|nr:alpha/beta hydrolase [Betaproteobacteria bacterium]
MVPEYSFAFGRDHGLVGTLTQVSAECPASISRGLILFNAGVLHRVGPHRLHVNIARLAAVAGVPTLRFDLHGHGDSLRPGGELGYDEQVDADLHDAIDELSRRCGVERIAILGFCSGALPTYRAALAHHCVDSILLYDAFSYPTLRSRLRRGILLLRHHGPLGTLRGVGARLLQRLSRRHQALGNQPVDPPISRGELVRGFNLLAQRGVRVVLAYSGGAFDEVNYAGQFRDATRRYGLSDRVAVEFEPDINHVVTSLAAQDSFRDLILRRWLRLAEVPGPADIPELDTDAGPEAR